MGRTNMGRVERGEQNISIQNLIQITFALNVDTVPIFKCARFEKGNRYYNVILDKDLFNDWVITIANGRISTKLGRIRKIAHTSFADACNQFHNVTKTRTKRGYLLEYYKTI